MPRYRTAQFLEAAGRCFRCYGLFRTRMEGIAAEVPCSKVTLYKQFPDKSALAAAWLTDQMSRSRDRTATILNGDQPFAAKVKQLVEQKQADLAQLGEPFTHDLFSPDCLADLRRELQQQIELNKQQTVQMIELGRAEGAMKAAGGLVSIPLLLLALMPAPGYWFAAPLPTWWALLGYIRLAEGQSIGWLWLMVGAIWLLVITTYLAIRLSRRSD